MHLSKKIKILFISFIVIFFGIELLGKEISCPIDSLLEQMDKQEKVGFEEDYVNAILNIDVLLSTIDTACVINIYRKYLNKNSENYNVVFKTLFRALLLADEANLPVEKFKINIEIGRYYGYLKRFDKSKEHFDRAGELKQKLIATNKLTNEMEQRFYMCQLRMYRGMEDFVMADLYLDSCYQLVDSTKLEAKHYFIKFERAVKFARDRQYEEAILTFESIIDSLKVKSPGYEAIIFHNMARAYEKLSQTEKSIEYFQKSIEVSEKQQKHLVSLPWFYNGLANVKYEIGHYQEAYDLLLESIDLAEKYNDSRSKENSFLLKVQDDFRIYKEEQEKISRQRELDEAEEDKRSLISNIIGLIGSIIFLSVLAIIYFRLQKEKIIAEKALNRQLKIQNAEKEQFLKRIEKKNEELMTFSNIMSHDLKAPIRNISAFSDLIKKLVQNGFDKEKIASFNDFINDSAKSMSVLIEDLLLYSKINLNEQELSKVDLNEVVDLVYPAFSYDVNRGYASVNIEKLPTILGNKGLLKTVFHNLISNAIKYQPKDDPDHRAIVNIWSVEEQNEYCIYIGDNGIGIKPDFFRQIV